jgi:hypothetical protein
MCIDATEQANDFDVFQKFFIVPLRATAKQSIRPRPKAPTFFGRNFSRGSFCVTNLYPHTHAYDGRSDRVRGRRHGSKQPVAPLQVRVAHAPRDAASSSGGTPAAQLAQLPRPKGAPHQEIAHPARPTLSAPCIRSAGVNAERNANTIIALARDVRHGSAQCTMLRYCHLYGTRI